MRNHNLMQRDCSALVSLAPMMDRTDRHFRFMLRQISRRTLLYTEMITTGALIHGDADRHLRFHGDEHPVAVQLGGDDPAALAQCAKMSEDAGYDEVNLNVGCPSNRVQKGCFGAILMRRPEHVADCIAAMRDAVSIPVTVKHRIGVDELDAYEDLANFVRVVAEAKPARFSVHARKAWLQGLSPKQNRTVPPLRYDDVYRLKRDFPDEVIEINGGIKVLSDVLTHLDQVDAVMIGRAAVDDPWIFSDVDALVYGGDHRPTRRAVIEAVAEYADRHLAEGGKLHHVSRHLLHLYRGCTGAREWRRRLTESSQHPDPRGSMLLDAIPPHLEAA